MKFPGRNYRHLSDLTQPRKGAALTKTSPTTVTLGTAEVFRWLPSRKRRWWLSRESALGVASTRAVAQIDFMLRQVQHEWKSHMISTYHCLPWACRRAKDWFGQQPVHYWQVTANLRGLMQNGQSGRLNIRRQEIIQKSRLLKKVNVNGGSPRMQDFFTEVVLRVTQASPVRNSGRTLFLAG